MSLHPPSSSVTATPKSQSQSRFRPRGSRHASTNSVPYLPQGPEALLLPEGSVSEEVVELLHEFVHPSHNRGRDKRRVDTEDTVVAEEDEETPSEFDDDDGEDEDGWEALKKRPWYRRPSPAWLLCITPFTSIAMSACAAPRVEIYTLLACLEHKPEYTVGKKNQSTSIDLDLDLYGSSDVRPIVFTDEPHLFEGLLSPSPFVTEEEWVGTFVKDESESSKCAADPVVQAAAAKLIAAMTTTMGILSCLTTAFWGSLSDRFGRLRVLGLSVIGLLLNDFNFIFVYFFSKQLPGGYWFLIVGPIIEGAFGGLTCVAAAMHAYLADCSAPGARSRLFSFGFGLIFIGMALGPTIGALLIHLTGSPLAVFYLATSVHLVYALWVWCVVPESLPLSARRANRRRIEERARREAEVEGEGEEGERRGKMVRVLQVLMKTKRVFAFLSPLSIFAPETVVAAPGTFLGKRRKDWSLTFVAAAYGFAAFVMGSYQYKFQYVSATFGWTSEELGYWLSLIGASRALYLTVILPIIIKVFNRPPPAIQLPIEPSEPLNSSEPTNSTLVGSSEPSSSDPDAPHAAHPQHTRAQLAPHSASFDLRLARASLALECICYAFIPLAPSALMFTTFGIIVSWGAGFNPAVQALALELYAKRNREAALVGGDEAEGHARDGGDERPRSGKKGGEENEGREAETGRLFGAMSVIQAMCSQILGPMVFGLTYVKTVASFPTAIFWLSSTFISAALVFICVVRLPKGAHSEPLVHGHVHDIERDATLVDADDDGSATAVRGRKARKLIVPS